MGEFTKPLRREVMEARSFKMIECLTPNFILFSMHEGMMTAISFDKAMSHDDYKLMMD